MGLIASSFVVDVGLVLAVDGLVGFTSLVAVSCVCDLCCIG